MKTQANLVPSHFDQIWRLLPHTFAAHLSRGSWKPYHYLSYISNVIAECIAKGNQKIIITAPPRHGKSELLSQWLPVWYLSTWPDKNVLMASYGAELATKFGRWCRNTITDHSGELKVKISADSSSVSRWHTTCGGSMVSLGLGGSVTGRGADLIIADDLIKNIADAQSPTLQKSLREWFKSTLFTRLEPGGSFLIVQTRWTKNDLIGFLKDEHSGEWTEIRLPAIAEEYDPLGREPGEALCPDRFNAKALLKIRDQIGPQLFDAMYQQNPSSVGIQMFRQEWWQYYTTIDIAELDAVIQSWDCGFYKSESAAYSVCMTIGIKDEKNFILDVFRQRLEFPDLMRAAKANYIKHHPQLILVESEAAGISLVQTLYNETNLPLKAIKLRNKTKAERAWHVTHLIEDRKVYLPKKAPWLASFIDEISIFPNGKYADQVDTLTQALDFLSSNKLSGRKKEPRRPSSGREDIYPETYFDRNCDRPFRLYHEHNFIR